MRSNNASTMTWNDIVGRRANSVVAGLRTKTAIFGRLWYYCPQGNTGGQCLPVVDSLRPSDRMHRSERFPQF
ncbi:MAG TPA: hypothetical protein PKD54_14240 [Pirellulaceae bacterium]|nr:hypothetical protein [Pirellulaceae bacterium]